MSELRVFKASWCRPCKALEPTLKELQSEGYNIVFVDVDEHGDMAQKFGVRGVPTMIKLDGEEVKGTLVGNKSKGEILKFIEE